MSDNQGDTSNTGANRQPGTFTKNDPRINRKGRPRTMDSLKRLILAELTRPATDANGDPIKIKGREGEEITTVQAVVIQGIHSKDWRRIEYVLNVAYGKVPDVHELTGKDGDKVVFEVRYRDLPKEPSE